MSGHQHTPRNISIIRLRHENLFKASNLLTNKDELRKKNIGDKIELLKMFLVQSLSHLTARNFHSILILMPS